MKGTDEDQPRAGSKSTIEEEVECRRRVSSQLKLRYNDHSQLSYAKGNAYNDTLHMNGNVFYFLDSIRLYRVGHQSKLINML